MHGIAIRRLGDQRRRVILRWAPAQCALLPAARKCSKRSAIANEARRLRGSARNGQVATGYAFASNIAEKCGVAPDWLTLLVARTASIAGTVQIVARSVETAMHKLHVLGFDLHANRAAIGNAPLPPVANDDLIAIGWTNDAILYGGKCI